MRLFPGFFVDDIPGCVERVLWAECSEDTPTLLPDAIQLLARIERRAVVFAPELRVRERAVEDDCVIVRPFRNASVLAYSVVLQSLALAVVPEAFKEIRQMVRNEGIAPRQVVVVVREGNEQT